MARIPSVEVERLKNEVSLQRLVEARGIECEDIEIRPLDNDAIGRRFPGWSKPGSPFLRRSVEECLKGDREEEV